MPDHRAMLSQVRTFDQLLDYLREELDWPLHEDDFDEVTFSFTPEELGIDPQNSAKIQEILRLRPLAATQPWGIFFVEFEPKRLPVVALRRILRQLAHKKQESANPSDRVVWAVEDLLFISSYGEGDHRVMTLAHFEAPTGRVDLPQLRVLGWDNQDTALHLDMVADKLDSCLRWPDDETNLAAWRKQWSAAFTLGHRQTITTAKDLAHSLAVLARAIRERILQVLAIETEAGPLTQIFKAFQSGLMHDLTASGFADTYAQTITYGLLSARIADPSSQSPDDLIRHMRTSPFLRELMERFLQVGGRQKADGGPGIDFDELGVAAVVEQLDRANMEAVLRDFGNQNRDEDPVMHFYQTFLSEYDHELRVKRGVFYTPQPVVSYIVRSVHELLQTEFGLADGLADITTWGEMLEKHADLKLPPLTDEPNEKRSISPNEPFVQILDPATGTATFLVEVIEVIHQTLQAKWKQQRLSAAEQVAAWNDYVPKHLLPRLHAYELMMAPYAIAHMKLGLKLAETGYRFESGERARIYLTNALEPWVRQLPLIGFDALAHEATSVNEVKRFKRFTVVIGNPPYSGVSSNMSEDAQLLVKRYRYVNGAALGERKLWLQNDYVKFLGLAHQFVLTTGTGCLGLITDNSYLDGPTFRGVRSNFLSDFSGLAILNLHGSAKKSNTALAGEIDQNVFDIAQGVSVVHGIRLPGRILSRVRMANMHGSRETKYFNLSKQTIATTSWSALDPVQPFFLFVERNRDGEAEYNTFFSVKKAFPTQSVGIQTSRDHLAIDFTRHELLAKVDDFVSPSSSDDEIRERYFPGKSVRDYQAGDTRGWSLAFARKELKKIQNPGSVVARIHYRPFDFRYVFNSTLLVDWPRPEVSEHMLSGKNLGLCLLRRTENRRDYDYFGVSRDTISNHQVSIKDGTYLLPLFLESTTGRQGALNNGETVRPNLSQDFLKAISVKLGLPQKGAHGLPAGLTAEDIFHYVYATFYSPNYRSRYAEFLMIDFPCVPLTSQIELFRWLAQLGKELIDFHLVESTGLDVPITEFVGRRDPVVELFGWTLEAVWLDGARTTGFKGVPEDVWNFHIGGYQVCEKWLKDRKGRVLSDEDITHYQKIVVALSETIRIMAEIDEVIEEHGGWPGAFATAPSAAYPEPSVGESMAAEPTFKLDGGQ